MVEQCAKVGFRLLPEEELDKYEPRVWEASASHWNMELPPLPPPLQEPGDSPMPSAAADRGMGFAGSGYELLGEKDTGVPDHVHAEMLRLARLGAIPSTTLKQRQRNKISGGTGVGVPSFFRLARQFGYISPSLPHLMDMFGSSAKADVFGPCIRRADRGVERKRKSDAQRALCNCL